MHVNISIKRVRILVRDRINSDGEDLIPFTGLIASNLKNRSIWYAFKVTVMVVKVAFGASLKRAQSSLKIFSSSILRYRFVQHLQV